MTADDYWLCKDDIGLRVFPRAGSTTLQKQFGRKHSRRGFDNAQHKFCIVRCPNERLLSAWLMYLCRTGFMRGLGYPVCKKFEEFAEYVVGTPGYRLDVHTRPMACMLHGWEPRDDELWVLEHFMQKPPAVVKIYMKERVHENKSGKYDPPLPVTGDLAQRFNEKFADDIELYERACVRRSK